MSTFILKPTLKCNLRCRYCYETHNGKNNNASFSTNLTEVIIDKIHAYSANQNAKKIKLIWHGGEALLWGIKNFEHAFYYCKQKFIDINVRHNIQTNLTLLNEDYINLFKQYDINIGFSIDGFPAVNDKTRVFSNGKGTSSIIEEKIQLCKKHDLKIGAIVVASKYNIETIDKIYEYMNHLGVSFKVNPIFECGEAENTFDEMGITSNEYADAMIKLFDIWTQDQYTNLNLAMFTEIAGNLGSGKTNLCCFTKNCQQGFTCISPNGDIFPCGRFCEFPDFNLGNIRTEDLEQVFEKKNIFFNTERFSKLKNEDCRDCRFLQICNGGCMHDSYISSNSIGEKTNLCGAYRKIFEHIEQYLKNNGIDIAI
jgi:uncharacterized protein